MCAKSDEKVGIAMYVNLGDVTTNFVCDVVTLWSVVPTTVHELLCVHTCVYTHSHGTI